MLSVLGRNFENRETVVHNLNEGNRTVRIPLVDNTILPCGSRARSGPLPKAVGPLTHGSRDTPVPSHNTTALGLAYFVRLKSPISYVRSTQLYTPAYRP